MLLYSLRRSKCKQKWPNRWYGLVLGGRSVLGGSSFENFKQKRKFSTSEMLQIQSPLDAFEKSKK